MTLSYARPAPRRYQGATNTEDDIAIIAARAALVGDDVGDDITNATRLPPLPASFSGLIGYGGDSDVFAFEAQRYSRVTVTLALVDPYYPQNGTQQMGRGQPRSDLDTELTLVSRDGRTLKSWSDASGLLFGAFKTDGLPYNVSEPCLGAGCWRRAHCWLGGLGRLAVFCWWGAWHSTAVTETATRWQGSGWSALPKVFLSSC